MPRENCINVVFGKRGNLSGHLKGSLNNVTLVSSGSIVTNLDRINWEKYKKINFILNQFQPSAMLNDISSPNNYIDSSLKSTSIILDYIKQKKINVNKIIYTSSSSVYGNNELCSEDDVPSVVNLHASLKVANEQLIKSVCNDIGIDYTIARIFNMYGGDDNFSIISKIISSYWGVGILRLINDGESIRDFIHIDDVVSIYREILEVRGFPIINVSTGIGQSVSSLLLFLMKNDININYKNVDMNEIRISISDNNMLLEIMKGYDFIKVDEYLLSKLKM